jgi:hypothetical protein
MNRLGLGIYIPIVWQGLGGEWEVDSGRGARAGKQRCSYGAWRGPAASGVGICVGGGISLFFMGISDCLAQRWEKRLWGGLTRYLGGGGWEGAGTSLSQGWVSGLHYLLVCALSVFYKCFAPVFAEHHLGEEALAAP